MKNFARIFFIAFLTIAVSYAKASSMVNKSNDNGNNDTTQNIKSNIVIFKMIPSPITNPTNTNGSLKKAGKVARTSYSHTSIENILYKKKGI